jgi:HEAT repeat protein
VKALGYSEDPGAVTVLVGALESSDPRLLTSAAWSLAKIGDPGTPTDRLIRLCEHDDVDVRNNALVAIRKVAESRGRLGASGLDDAQMDIAFPIIELAIVDPRDPIVRGNAAAAFGALRERRAVDSLIDRLRDTHPYIRTHTALALGKIGDSKAIKPLVEVIDESPRGTPRSAVLISLEMLLQRAGRSVPDHLGDAERDWKVFVAERFGPPGEPFER